MDNCSYFRNQIEFDFDGELTIEERQQLNAHLAICQTCREYREEIGSLWGYLESAMLFEPPGEIAGPVIARIRKRRTWRLAGLTGIALLSVISLVPVSAGILNEVLNLLFHLNLDWIPNFLGSLWSAVNVLLRSLMTVAELLPDEYWLGLSVLVIINLAMLLKLLGFSTQRGGSLG